MKDISISAKFRSSLFKSPITAEAADYIDAQAARIEQLQAALGLLRFEAGGLQAFEAEVRHAIGNSNFNALMHRVNQAATKGLRRFNFMASAPC